MRRGTLWLVAALAAGCGLSRPEGPRRSEALEISARMLRQLDKLEADLHQGEAQNTLYTDLVQRHGQAQQIACKVTEEHVDEIHRLATAQQEKLEQRLGQRRHDRAQRKKKVVAQLTPRGGRS